MSFTYADLKKTIDHINGELVKAGKAEKTLKAEARNGYYGLDVYKGQERLHCLHTVAISKRPIGLVSEAYQWGFNALTSD